METKDVGVDAPESVPLAPPALANEEQLTMDEENKTVGPPATAAAPPTANYNVRELLELERKIYEESIEKQRRLHARLQRGELHEYLVQCLPLERDRDREIEVAKTRLQFNRRNASDLLAFELKQSEDVYEARCLTLKQRLTAALERERARIVRRLEEVQQGLPLTFDDDTGVPSKTSISNGHESPTDTSILTADGSLDTAALEQQLAASQVANLAAFNLQHLEHNVPPPSAIVADVVQEVERQRAFQKEVADPDTVCGVVVDPNVGKVWIGLMDVFTVLDHVVLWSCLSDEEFYGQIVKVDADRIDLALLCGSRVSVSVEQLRKQLCTLRLQSSPAPEAHGVIDERLPRTPKRKRQRRKHTIGMRQKI